MRSFTGRTHYLLFALLGFIVIHPAMQGSARNYLGYAFLLLIPIAGVFSLGGRRRNLIAGGVLAALGLAAGIHAVIDARAGVLRPTGLTAATMLIYYTSTIRHLLQNLLRARFVTQETLVSAACVYLLVGLAFAFAYMWVQIAIPGSFASAAGAAFLDLPTLVYFSFVTLATLGYGDIAPVSPIARSLATLEAIFGVMYLAIVISRMVTLVSRSEIEPD